MSEAIMPYNRDTSFVEVGSPRFVFPGDEQVDLESYTDALTNTYLGRVPTAIAAIEHLGVSLDDESTERFRRLMVCMGWLDHILDESPDAATARTTFDALVSSFKRPVKQSSDMPAWVRPELPDAVYLLGNALSALSNKQVDGLTKKALRIGEISIQKAKIVNVKEYIGTLTEEGALTADLAIECLGPTAQESPYYEKLHAWSRQGMIAATLIDCAQDLRDDYTDKLTGVKPTIWNRFLLYKKAILSTFTVLHGLGLRGTVKVSKAHHASRAQGNPGF